MQRSAEEASVSQHGITIDLPNSPFRLAAPGNYLKSTLLYPGVTSRAVKHIPPFIRTGETGMPSSSLADGSVEVACSDFTPEVGTTNAFGPPTTVRHPSPNGPEELAGRVTEYYPLPPERFYALKRIFTQITDGYEMGTVLFVLNRSSFSEPTLSGGMPETGKRFTPPSIQRLRDFKVPTLFVEQADFERSIPRYPDHFLYCDPPYIDGQRLYGIRGNRHTNFHHQALADILHTRDRSILSYNNCDEIRRMYQGYNIVPLTWANGMTSNRSSGREILVLSPGVWDYHRREEE